MTTLVLDGESLNVETLWRAARAAADPAVRLRIEVAGAALARVRKAEAFLDGLAKSGQTVYGVNTGFGFFARTPIAPDEIRALQRNIILSHAAGVGERLPREVAMWLILVNSVCRGRRGLGVKNLERVLAALNAGLLACIPARGSVGASGDLAPAAHAVLALLGEGECTIPDGDGFAALPAREALARLGLAPLELGPKEGLCLINGTHLTAALAVRLWNEARNLLAHANLAAAMSIEAMRASHDMLTPYLLAEERHEGTRRCGTEVAAWLGSSATEIQRSHKECGKVQDPYSLRCVPQVHGAVWEDLQHTRQVLDREINATTDNPILFPEQRTVIHGGNFHAIYPARVNDTLASALTTLAAIAERRIAMAMKQERTGLPDFLIREGGLHSGFMMAQTTAAALVSESRSLCFPASVDSIPTSNDQEDHVSMGPGAGLKAIQVAANARHVLAIELLAAAQGIDLLRPLRTSERLEAVHAALRRHVSFLDADRFLGRDIETLASVVESGGLVRSA